MTKQVSKPPSQLPLAAVEADLFGAILGFHKKTVTLLRDSSLDDEKLKVVADRLKTLLDTATAEMKGTQQLEVAFEEVKRLVEELSDSDDGGQKG